jgi:hypothetical protein
MGDENDRERQAYENGREAGRLGKPELMPYYEDLNLDALWESGYDDGKRQREREDKRERERWEAEQQEQYEERQRRR